jgi:hypothetical protein
MTAIDVHLPALLDFTNQQDAHISAIGQQVQFGASEAGNLQAGTFAAATDLLAAHQKALTATRQLLGQIHDGIVASQNAGVLIHQNYWGTDETQATDIQSFLRP